MSYTSYAEVVSQVNQQLSLISEEYINRSGDYSHDYKQLWQNIADYLSHGGKRLRPYIVILSYEAYGGKSTKSILPVATAWELLHAALLMHDDIIDRDNIRHGKKNISGIYEEKYQSKDSAHFALSTALLAGDLLISGAHDIVWQADISDTYQKPLHELLKKALFGVVGGELVDTVSVEKPIMTVDARLVATQKTAEYSFIYPLLTGATLADVSDEEQQLLYSLGESVGLAYQLVDDILGVFGDEGTTGKSVTSDIAERKRTVLLQETFNHIDSDDQSWLEEIYSLDREIEPSDIEKIKQLMISSGARQKLEHEIEVIMQKAEIIISKLHISGEAKEQFEVLIKKICKRKS